MTEIPRFDDMIEFDNRQEIQDIVNNPALTLSEKVDELHELTKPLGFYKKKILEQYIEINLGEEFLLCII